MNGVAAHCQITLEPFTDLVLLSNGFVCERSTAAKWMKLTTPRRARTSLLGLLGVLGLLGFSKITKIVKNYTDVRLQIYGNTHKIAENPTNHVRDTFGFVNVER